VKLHHYLFAIPRSPDPNRAAGSNPWMVRPSLM